MTEQKKKKKKKQTSNSDEKIVTLLKDWEWITSDQVSDCEISQSKLKELDMNQSILEVMVAKGYLNDTQKTTVLEELGIKKKKGVSLPGFQLEKKVGRGGMGMVFRANRTSNGEIVAIKILPLKMGRSKNLRQRFVREAKAATRLNHPNLVRAFEVHHHEGYLYYVMEYVDGQDLSKIIEDGEYLPEKQALKIIRQVVLALEHSHKNNFIHRDVKPENILIDKTGMVKLGDLGLAKNLGEQDHSLTMTGMPIGSPRYISPEQAKGVKNVDLRSDIYSLGATLYRMVVGHPPFDGDSAPLIMSKHINEILSPPIKFNPELSGETNRLILKMMSKLPQNRHNNISEVLKDIDSILTRKKRKSPASVHSKKESLPSERLGNPPPLPPQANLAKTNQAPSLSTNERYLILGGIVAFLVLILAAYGFGLFSGVSSPEPDFNPLVDEEKNPTPNPNLLKREKAQKALNRYQEKFNGVVSSFKDLMVLQEELKFAAKRYSSLSIGDEFNRLYNLTKEKYEQMLKKRFRHLPRHLRWLKDHRYYDFINFHLKKFPQEFRETLFYKDLVKKYSPSAQDVSVIKIQRYAMKFPPSAPIQLQGEWKEEGINILSGRGNKGQTRFNVGESSYWRIFRLEGELQLKAGDLAVQSRGLTTLLAKKIKQSSPPEKGWYSFTIEACEHYLLISIENHYQYYVEGSTGIGGFSLKLNPTANIRFRNLILHYPKN